MKFSWKGDIKLWVLKDGSNVSLTLTNITQPKPHNTSIRLIATKFDKHP